MDYAKEHDLGVNIIEKDYVLNWLLAGITNNKKLRTQWIFKGGTCLKKCYFEKYRFSEDLDFTIKKGSDISKDSLKSEFTNIAEWVYETSGIEISIENLIFEEYKNPRGHLSIEGKVAYKGPLQRNRGGKNYPTIKLNLTDDEIIVCNSISRSIYHPYSDLLDKNMVVQSYCVEEIFAEKLRALIERLSPRDLYDVIHLHTDKRWNPSKPILLNVLKEKCEFKNVQIPTMKLIESLPNVKDLEADWHDMLAHQIANLEPCEYYWSQLSTVFEWLYSKEK